MSIEQYTVVFGDHLYNFNTRKIFIKLVTRAVLAYPIRFTYHKVSFPHTYKHTHLFENFNKKTTLSLSQVVQHPQGSVTIQVRSERKTKKL